MNFRKLTLFVVPMDSTIALTLVFKDAKGVPSRLELKVPVATAAVHSH